MPVNSTQRDGRLRAQACDGTGVHLRRCGCLRCECPVGWRVGVVKVACAYVCMRIPPARRLEARCELHVLRRCVTPLFVVVRQAGAAAHVRHFSRDLRLTERSTTRGNGLRLLLVWVYGRLWLPSAGRVELQASRRSAGKILHWASNQVRRPAEFKHITKRRKRN